jgi:hypothetical protein
MVSILIARLNSRIATRDSFRVVVLAVAVVVIGGLQGVVDARPATNTKSLADAGKKPAPKTTLPAVDRETEAKSLELVQTHLPELRAVLKRLKADQPRQYDRAIRDLAKSFRKLEQAKNRDERLYDIEVEFLKAQNQVNLLTAKLKVRDRQSDRKLLRVAAGRLQQALIARASYDVELYRQRLERTQKQFDSAQDRLEAKQTDTDQQLDKTYLSLLRKAGREPEPKKN